MTLFYIRFKKIDPNRGTPYFGNFVLPHKSVDEVLKSLKENETIAAVRLYASIDPKDPEALIVNREEERSIHRDAIDMVAVSRFKTYRVEK
ncbi:hypothetical protein EVB27_113 [Rhizobium phage RHph_TM16]|nr:hypothetical protein EVB27_113 [Rhizobium phage RHph_TM16]